MALQNKKIGIIGAGVAGLTSAIALSRLGAEITLFEKAHKLTEVGAGLQISANGLCVLSALGVDAEYANPVSRPKGVELRDYKKGKLISRVAQNTEPSHPFLQIHRADLIAALEDRVKQMGVKIKLGHDAVLSDPLSKKVEVICNDKAMAFDVVIAADGVNSNIRQTCFEGAPARYLGQVAWRVVVPMQGDQDFTQVYLGPHKHLVSYPLRGGKLRNIVAIQKQAMVQRQSWAQSGDPAELQRAFSGFCPEAQQVLSDVKTAKLWGLYGHKPLQTWVRGKVALIGDAAHPMLPSMAQGACMAIEDAYVLAQKLDKFDDVSTGLQAYEYVRKSRTTALQRQSKANASLFHLANPILRFGVHTGLRLMDTIAPLKAASRFDWIYHHDVTQP